jgi:DNA-binding CsgD family transcriptional regulator
MIAGILGVTYERANRLCETGVFSSAQKIRNSYWSADINEVLEYKGRAGEGHRDETNGGEGGATWEKLAPFLGKMSDYAVARLTGVSRQTVIRYRKKAGIGNKKAALKWEDFDALLGKAPDKEIARLAGCSLNAVHNRRKKLKIPPFDKWEGVDSLLKGMSDEEIAGELGCSPETVRERRKLYKMPSPRKPAPRQGLKSAGGPKAGAENPDGPANGADAALSRYLTIDMLIAMREEGKGDGPR